MWISLIQEEIHTIINIHVYIITLILMTKVCDHTKVFLIPLLTKQHEVQTVRFLLLSPTSLTEIAEVPHDQDQRAPVEYLA